MPFTIGGDRIPEPAETSAKSPVKVIKEKRRGSYVTLILNLGPHQTDLKKTCSALKQSFACGGSVKEENIELQGDQVENAKAYLKKIGIKIR